MEQALVEHRPDRRALLRPGWLVLHVLVVVALVVMVRLGLWQWHRGEGSGGLRNYSYGLEWWAFAALTVVGWTKFCLDETSGGREEPADEAEPQRTAAAAEPERSRALVDDEDPELAAWNARFAELARREGDQRR